MALDKSYLDYPMRRHGMDHDLYPWSNIFERKPVSWPEGKKVALWITVSVEFFPLTPNEGPFRAPGHMVTPFPDLRTFTTKDYGNRVGVYRIMKVLDALGLVASAPMNAAVAGRYPELLNDVVARNWEIIAHGTDMNHIHYGGMEIDREREQVAAAVNGLRELSGQPVTGWLSPARSESENTLSLLSDHDIEYVCDWMNDDMPFQITAEDKKLVAMPFTDELEDRKQLITLGHLEAAYEEEVLTAFDLFKTEAETHGGRILHLALTPYVIGQPFRIQSLKHILETISSDASVWNATGTDILKTWQAQQ
jgi:peptidoglycan/xylan/chitin deacetylase (PgdA/CDA1 family)